MKVFVVSAFIFFIFFIFCCFSPQGRDESLLWRLFIMSFASITLFDSILFAILFLFILYGLWMGCQKQLPFIIALIGSYVASAQYAGDLMPHLNQFIETPKIIFGGLFIILLITSTLLLKLISVLLSKIIQVTIVGWFDRFFLGAPLALLKGVILVVVVTMFLAATLSPADQFFQKSLTTPYLEQGIEMARKIIVNPEVRDDFRPQKVAVIPSIQQDVQEQQENQKEPEELMPPVPSHSEQMQQEQQEQEQQEQVENFQDLQEAPQIQEFQESEEFEEEQDFQNPELPPESEESLQMQELQEAQFPQDAQGQEESENLQQL
ncbi:MAG: CvpA family protein [Candidatus Electrothrix sp. AS4_5]|nr:CvpA family protein [Candidatus Electrothrix gigas]